MRQHLVRLFVIFLLLTVPHVSAAQTRTSGTNRDVQFGTIDRTAPGPGVITIVLVDTLATKSMIALARRTVGGQHIVVLRAADATPEVLSQAVELVYILRRRHPGAVDANQDIALTRGVMPNSMFRDRDFATQTLASLRAAPMRQIQDFGRGRAVIVSVR